MQVILSVCMAIALVETCCGDYHPEIKWQAHSYNDMRSWPALFRKGTSFLKIDVNWQRGWLCREQVRVVNRTDSRGCFILNHNDPSLIAYRKDYNTTADLVSILASPSHPLYRHFAQERRVIVALCFKGPMNSMCDNGTDTLAWISLVDELVTSLNRVRASDPLLNVEFVLDGGVPQACLIQRWRPWVSTGGSAVAFTANDTATGSDRWQVVMNTFEVVGEIIQLMPYMRAGHESLVAGDDEAIRCCQVGQIRKFIISVSGGLFAIASFSVTRACHT